MPKSLRHCLLLLLMLLSPQLWAYSYSGTGIEPLIEGREALFKALLAKDPAAVKSALAKLSPELLALEGAAGQPLLAPLQEAIQIDERATVEGILDRAFKVQFSQLLETASHNLSDYQVAKVTLMRAKRYLDWLEPNLEDTDVETADDAMAECLDSLGNPGVFGAGAVAPDAARFDSARNRLLHILDVR